MIRLDHKYVGPAERIDATVRLDFAARQRGGRRQAVCTNSEIVEFDLAPGNTLADGDILTDARESIFVRVSAAAEVLSYVHCVDKRVLNRICYHLGQRGVVLQIHADAIAYRHDPALDVMVAEFGLPPQICCCAFHPEHVWVAAAQPAASSCLVATGLFESERRQASG